MGVKKKLTDEERLEAKRASSRKYNLLNKEKIKLYREEYLKENKEIIAEKRKEYSLIFNKKNPDYQKEYRKQNSKEIKTKRNIYLQVKKETDPLFKLTCSIRGAIRQSFKRSSYTKNSKTYQILGCSFEEVKQYLENKFEDWMSWDNRGLYNGTPNYGWDIDHIIPLASATTEDELIKLNHYSNLQPLCSYINRDIKKDKCIDSKY